MSLNLKVAGSNPRTDDFLAPPAERQRSFSNADSSVVRRPSVRRPSSTFQLKA